MSPGGATAQRARLCPIFQQLLLGKWLLPPLPRPVPGTRPQVATCVSGGSVGAQGSSSLRVLSPQAWSHSQGPQRPGLPGAFPRRKPTGAQNSSEISSGRRGPNVDEWDLGTAARFWGAGQRGSGCPGSHSSWAPCSEQLSPLVARARGRQPRGLGEPRLFRGRRRGGRSPVRALRQAPRALGASGEAQGRPQHGRCSRTAATVTATGPAGTGGTEHAPVKPG